MHRIIAFCVLKYVNKYYAFYRMFLYQLWFESGGIKINELRKCFV